MYRQIKIIHQNYKQCWLVVTYISFGNNIFVDPDIRKTICVDYVAHFVFNMIMNFQYAFNKYLCRVG